MLTQYIHVAQFVIIMTPNNIDHKYKNNIDTISHNWSLKMHIDFN